MAITKLMNIKSSPHGAGRHLCNSIRYILNPEKTKDGMLVGGNSGTALDEVYRTMKETKMEWGKTDGRQGYHFVLSWKPGELDRDTAYQTVKEFCEEYLGDNYDYVFSIHDDQEHMHGHIVFNSVRRTDGYKYHYKKGDWEKHIQPVTDKICERHGLPKLEFDNDRKGKSYAETMAEKGGNNTWNKIIQADIDYAISQSRSYPEFLDVMKKLGYQIKPRNRNGKPELSLKAPGQGNARRTSALGTGYSLADIQSRIGREGSMPSFPKAPKLSRCSARHPLKPYSVLTRYQVKRVRMLHQANNRFWLKNPYAVNQSQIRKNLLHIDRLREDCRYLLRFNIHDEAELASRENLLKKEERILKGQNEIRYMVKKDDVYKKYADLQQELEGIPEWDDRFEGMEDQMEELEKKLPVGSEETAEKLVSIRRRLDSIRQEKRIIRHIRKEDGELKSLALKELEKAPQGGNKKIKPSQRERAAEQKLPGLKASKSPGEKMADIAPRL